MEFECVLCSLQDDSQVPAIGVVFGISVCDRDLHRVMEVIVDRNSDRSCETIADILKDAKSGNW